MHEQHRHPADPPVIDHSLYSPPPMPEVREDEALIRITGWSSERPPSVLLIDDDALMREMLVETLEAVGCVVTASPTAVPWMVYCTNKPLKEPDSHYDLVVSDIRMPEIDGLSLLENMTAMQGTPPTILITAFGDAQTHDRAIRAGAVTVLNKPFSIQTFLYWVDRALGSAY